MISRKRLHPLALQALTLLASLLPRGHLLAATTVAALTAALLVLVPSERVEAKRIALEIPLHIDSELLSGTTEQSTGAEHAGSTSFAGIDWREERVRRGDTLTTVFRRLSLDLSDVQAVTSAEPDHAALAKLQVGETVAVAFDDAGTLSMVRYSPSPTETYLYEYLGPGDGFARQHLVTEPERVKVARTAAIRSSLFVDAEAIGLSHAQIMELAGIFAWDIDFALDLREGDSFSVLFEEEYLDGRKIGNGDILAARFTNQGAIHTAVRFVAPDGSADYYTPDGRPMRKAFLRAPVDFTRVSSNFNPRRLHPVFKTVRPHNGIDYAAPRGTPIYAAGNGKVIRAGYTGPNGNFVVVQHGSRYTTKYLHLDKRMVKTGQTIRQGEVLGTVGSTGYATGPHLHYEFLVDGVHRNPRTVDLPKADPIPARLRGQFAAGSQTLLAQLDSLAGAPLALRD
ncbi:MAG: peptidoglycan DD-metalloendopeptidase family protein [Pseudomonadota bacterium]